MYMLQLCTHTHNNTYHSIDLCDLELHIAAKRGIEHVYTKHTVVKNDINSH